MMSFNLFLFEVSRIQVKIAEIIILFLMTVEMKKQKENGYGR